MLNRKKGWQSESSGRAPVKQTQGFQFKPKYHPQKKKKAISFQGCKYVLTNKNQ
jgi:hypothetical protein